MSNDHDPSLLRYHTTDELPLILTVSDLRAFFGISRSSAYRLSHLPGFPTIRVGHSLRVPKEKLLLWIEDQSVKIDPEQSPKIVQSDE